MCILGKVKKVVEVPQDKAILAYRSWNIGLQSTSSVRAKTKWRLGKVVRTHAKPTAINQYGLYCFTSPAARKNGLWKTAMMGTIKIWGTVVFHESGYRASHAEIVKITKGKEYLPNLEAVGV